jgi:hypothetical protein
VAQAIDKALRYRRPNRDVILAYCMEQDHPQALTFSLAGREHLAGITVAPPQLESYRALIGQEVTV